MGFRNREDCMSSCLSLQRGVVAAGVFGLLVVVGPAFGQAPPGFSPLDKSDPAKSGQDTGLRPIPTPPTATAVDKLPLDKIKLPAGFKAELWSSGHPGARTMVM